MCSMHGAHLRHVRDAEHLTAAGGEAVQQLCDAGAEPCACTSVHLIQHQHLRARVPSSAHACGAPRCDARRRNTTSQYRGARTRAVQQGLCSEAVLRRLCSGGCEAGAVQ
jgi:hypothetical protein